MRWRSCPAQRITAATTALLRQGDRAWQATSHTGTSQGSGYRDWNNPQRAGHDHSLCLVL